MAILWKWDVCLALCSAGFPWSDRQWHSAIRDSITRHKHCRHACGVNTKGFLLQYLPYLCMYVCMCKCLSCQCLAAWWTQLGSAAYISKSSGCRRVVFCVVVLKSACWRICTSEAFSFAYRCTCSRNWGALNYYSSAHLLLHNPSQHFKCTHTCTVTCTLCVTQLQMLANNNANNNANMQKQLTLQNMIRGEERAAALMRALFLFLILKERGQMHHIQKKLSIFTSKNK